MKVFTGIDVKRLLGMPEGMAMVSQPAGIDDQLALKRQLFRYAEMAAYPLPDEKQFIEQRMKEANRETKEVGERSRRPALDPTAAGLILKSVMAASTEMAAFDHPEAMADAMMGKNWEEARENGSKVEKWEYEGAKNGVRRGIEEGWQGEIEKGGGGEGIDETLLVLMWIRVTPTSEVEMGRPGNGGEEEVGWWKQGATLLNEYFKLAWMADVEQWERERVEKLAEMAERGPGGEGARMKWAGMGREMGSGIGYGWRCWGDVSRQIVMGRREVLDIMKNGGNGREALGKLWWNEGLAGRKWGEERIAGGNEKENGLTIGEVVIGNWAINGLAMGRWQEWRNWRREIEEQANISQDSPAELLLEAAEIATINKSMRHWSIMMSRIIQSN